MSCWTENPADKDKFPAPSHFLFSCFGWGSLQGSAGAELRSWHFLGSVSLQREGKKKSGSSVPRLCNLVTSLWHFCQGLQGGEGRMEGLREGMAGPVYPLQELSQVLWSLCPCWGVSMNCEKPWERPHSWGEWKGRSAPHTGSITWCPECPKKMKWHCFELREAQGLPLPQKIFALVFWGGLVGLADEGPDRPYCCKYPSSRICLHWTQNATEWSKPGISNLLFRTAVLKLKFCFEGARPEGKLFCGWCADLYKGRIKVLLFFFHKNVHGDFSMENSSKWTLGSKILNSMGQHMSWKPEFSSRY